MKEFKIGNLWLGEGHPTIVVAELSANHNGKLEIAKESIKLAKKAGANAIKLQTYRADTITLDCDKEDFLIPNTSPWKEQKRLFDLYNIAHTPWEWHGELFKLAKSLDLEIFSSPFDNSAIDFLEELDCVAYKIASPEITDISLIARAAQTKKPVILSSGAAELEDLLLAVQTLKSHGCTQYVILKCTSAYPAPPESFNLRTIPDIENRFQCFAGLSDHSVGIEIPISAVSIGAKMIEKHFVDSKETEAIDAFFSLDPIEFGQMTKAIRMVEMALGKVDYSLHESGKLSYRGRRSLYICKNVNKGESVTQENIKSVRPGFGLHPKYLNEIIGLKFNKNLQKGDRLKLEDLQK